MKIDRSAVGRDRRDRKTGYADYKTSFCYANKHLKRNLLLNNIDLKFVHENYYSQRLQ